MSDGYVTRAPLIEAGFVPSTDLVEGTFAVARRLGWRRKVDPGLRPGASLTELRRIAKQFAFNAQLPRHDAMSRALEDLLAGNDAASGRLRLETETTNEGTVRWLHVSGRKDLRLQNVPVLHLDATMPVDLVRHYLPRLQIAADIEINAPHQRVTQVVGLPTGKGALLPDDPDPAKAVEATRRRQRFVATVRHLSRGRRTLVITYKRFEGDFTDIPGVETGHFGAVEGLDCWGDVEALFVIGAPRPKTQAVERMAADISGKPVRCAEMFARQSAIRLKGGGRHPISEYVYADAEGEAVRRAVTEAAVVQAIGRGRGVNRTASNPLEVYVILHDTALPMEVDEVAQFSDLEPDAIDKMIGRGLVPQMPTDAARLYRDLFPTREAAKKAYQRAGLSVERGSRLGTSPYREVPIMECPHARVRYQPQGKGQVPRIALVDPVKVPDARAVLEAALGPLALFEALPPAPRVWQLDMFVAVCGAEIPIAPGIASPDTVAAVAALARGRGQSQGEVAEDIGVSASHWSNWRKGRFGLSLAAASRLQAWVHTPRYRERAP